MSKIDDLKRFDDEWSRHLEWRQDRDKKINIEAKSYLPGKGSGKVLNLVSVPRAVEQRVLANIEFIIERLVDGMHSQERAQLIAAARQEATDFLEATPPPPPPLPPPPPEEPSESTAP